MSNATAAAYKPGDRVYRWWYSFPDQADAQPLTVVRVNRLTVTVRTDAGSVFRIKPHQIEGFYAEDADA